MRYDELGFNGRSASLVGGDGELPVGLVSMQPLQAPVEGCGAGESRGVVSAKLLAVDFLSS